MLAVMACTARSLRVRVRASSNTTSSMLRPSAISAARKAAAGTRSVKGDQER